MAIIKGTSGQEYYFAIHATDLLQGMEAHNLPPSNYNYPMFPVDGFENPHPSWDKKGFVIKTAPPGHQKYGGFWLDWSGFTARCGGCDNVAIMVSIQGWDPILWADSEDNLSPIKKGGDRGQNYLPIHNDVRYINPGWLDGYVDDEGKVHQFVITEDEQAMISKIKLPPEKAKSKAVAFRFFRIKDSEITKLSQPEGCHGYRGYHGTSGYSGITGYSGISPANIFFASAGGPGGGTCSSATPRAQHTFNANDDTWQHLEEQLIEDADDYELGFASLDSEQLEVEESKVGVGAGAAINQKVPDDILESTAYDIEPDAEVVIYMADDAQWNSLVGGKMVRASSIMKDIPYPMEFETCGTPWD